MLKDVQGRVGVNCQRVFDCKNAEWGVRTAGYWLAWWINGFMHSTIGAQLDVCLLDAQLNGFRCHVKRRENYR